MTARTALLVLATISSPALAQTDFSSHWHDGRSEIDGYRWTVNRYGEQRTGPAVMIFVTEPFSASRKVKVNDPTRNPRDTVDVLKLNLVRDFQTGIYDYNTMASVFSRSDDFSPLKISFSSAEWCGHVYEELLFDRNRVTKRLFSYFEGESSEATVGVKSDGVTEDNLFILLRGLRGPFLEPGGRVEVPFLHGAFHRRLTHQRLEWTTAEIERRPAAESIEVPAGTFSTSLYIVRTDDGREGRFWIEQAHPHRIVRWEWGPGRAAESGELTGSVRLKYWQLNGNGDERHLQPLGLTGAAPRE
ncbi:MAG: hypothetical protein ACYSU7_13385 [Planctomycetota bacterium]